LQSQCNGAVERFNQSFINKLAKFVYDDIENWSNMVNTALYSYNICNISRLGASPLNLLYSREPYDFSLDNLTNVMISDKSIGELDKIRNKLINETIKKREKEMADLPKKDLPDDLKEGQLVRKRKFAYEMGSKFESSWSVPFWIIKNNGKGCYWIRCLDGNTFKINRRDIDPIEQDNES
ncbi:pol polyprotein, partial [Pseudoloma neurophilia]